MPSAKSNKIQEITFTQNTSNKKFTAASNEKKSQSPGRKKISLSPPTTRKDDQKKVPNRVGNKSPPKKRSISSKRNASPQMNITIPDKKISPGRNIGD